MAEITTIASSTSSHSDRINANIDKKLNVCQFIAIIEKVIKKTIGAEIQATSASLTQIIKNKVVKTSATVIKPSLIR
jgi:hypothetical protein